MGEVAALDFKEGCYCENEYIREGPPRNVLKATLFTLTINVTNTIFTPNRYWKGMRSNIVLKRSNKLELNTYVFRNQVPLLLLLL